MGLHVEDLEGTPFPTEASIVLRDRALVTVILGPDLPVLAFLLAPIIFLDLARQRGLQVQLGVR